MAQGINALCGGIHAPTLARTPSAAMRKWAMLAAACGTWAGLPHGVPPTARLVPTLRRNMALRARVPRGAAYPHQY